MARFIQYVMDHVVGEYLKFGHKKSCMAAALFKLGAQEGTRTPTKLLAST